MVNSQCVLGAVDRTIGIEVATKEFDEEVIDYVVIHKPFTNISAATNITYGLSYNISSNLIFRPRIDSTFAYNLFRKLNVEHVAGEAYEAPYNPSHHFGNDNAFKVYKGAHWAYNNVLP